MIKQVKRCIVTLLVSIAILGITLDISGCSGPEVFTHRGEISEVRFERATFSSGPATTIKFKDGTLIRVRGIVNGLAVGQGYEIRYFKKVTLISGSHWALDTIVILDPPDAKERNW